MFLILIIAFTCILSADEYHNLGQSPRSATIFKRSTMEYMVMGSIMPSTMIPRARVDEIIPPSQQQQELATNHIISIGTLYHVNKHIDMICSIGAQYNTGRFYVPILLEGRIYPVKGSIRPFFAGGFGGMIGKQIGLFSTTGIGLNIHLSRKVSTEIQYRRIRGSVLLNLKNDSIMDLNQNGVLFGVNLLL